MESNRDAADQCYKKALLALKSGDVEKAKRLAQKSNRLFESEKSLQLIEVFYIVEHTKCMSDLTFII